MVSLSVTNASVPVHPGGEGAIKHWPKIEKGASSSERKKMGFLIGDRLDLLITSPSVKMQSLRNSISVFLHIGGGTDDQNIGCLPFPK
jgi:hypothetical protein